MIYDVDKQLDTQTGRVRDGGDYLGLIQKLGFLLLPTDWPRHVKVVTKCQNGDEGKVEAITSHERAEKLLNGIPVIV